MSRVLPVIVATAGHVDHGKTALVEALTGCNTDRLPQEKERGLSIDIGFASCPLDREKNVGIVDLPGHEDYIRNMAAGAACARILLLVVAADESVMPQTREHLEVVSQLAAVRIILVITKIDLVPEEYCEVVREDAVKLLQGYGLSADAVYYTSVKTLEGISQLRAGLAAMLKEVGEELDQRDFRVFIERTFLAKGHGIVVTGVPISGCISCGDLLELAGNPVRVRGIESFGQKVDSAGSGGCLALNIDNLQSGQGRDHIERGAVLSAPGYSPSEAYIVRINRVSVEFAFKRVIKCRLHTGTYCGNASVKVFGESVSADMQEGYAHLKLEKPSVLVAGDRFLLRAARPLGNIAGGVVLAEEGSYRLSNKDSYRLTLFAEASEAVKQGRYLLSELLAGWRYIVSRGDLVKLGHLSGDLQQKRISELVAAGHLLSLCRDWWMIAAKQEVFAEIFLGELRRYHRENRYRAGMEFDMAARILGLPVAGVDRILKIFSGWIALDIRDGVIAWRDFQPEFTGRAQEFYQVLEQSLTAEPGFWLALGEVREKCMVTARESQEVVRVILSQGLAVIIGGKYLVSTAEIARLRWLVLEVFRGCSILSIAYWRERSGLSRNHAVLALEYFDGINLTRRVESGRELIGNIGQNEEE